MTDNAKSAILNLYTQTFSLFRKSLVQEFSSLATPLLHEPDIRQNHTRNNMATVTGYAVYANEERIIILR